MSIVVRYSPDPPASKEQYDKSTELFSSKFGEGFIPDGCEMHVAFLDSNGNIRVSEIWDSREQWQAFGEKLMPILSEIGVTPGEPEVFEVYRLEKR